MACIMTILEWNGSIFFVIGFRRLRTKKPAEKAGFKLFIFSGLSCEFFFQLIHRRRFVDIFNSGKLARETAKS